MQKKLTLATVRNQLNAIGVRIISGRGEYQVKLKGPEHASTGYFTDDLQDAFDTGRAMAQDRTAKEQAAATVMEQHPTHPASLSGCETFAEYLARVGQDQLESGRECTAQDYAQASARIAELETDLRGYAAILFACANGNPPRPATLLAAHGNAMATVENRFQHLTA